MLTRLVDSDSENDDEIALVFFVMSFTTAFVRLKLVSVKNSNNIIVMVEHELVTVGNFVFI